MSGVTSALELLKEADPAFEEIDDLNRLLGLINEIDSVEWFESIDWLVSPGLLSVGQLWKCFAWKFADCCLLSSLSTPVFHDHISNLIQFCASDWIDWIRPSIFFGRLTTSQLGNCGCLHAIETPSQSSYYYCYHHCCIFFLPASQLQSSVHVHRLRNFCEENPRRNPSGWILKGCKKHIEKLLGNSSSLVYGSLYLRRLLSVPVETNGCHHLDF